MKKNRNDVFIRLNSHYIRSGNRTDKGTILYEETGDNVELYNKYTYHVNYKTDPYMALSLISELYAGRPGKHPLTAIISSGMTRTFKKLWDLDINLGLQGTRDYIKLDNTFGTNSKFILNKSFSDKSFIRSIYSDTDITWSPMAKYHMAFYLKNKNEIKIYLWKKFNIAINIESYAYRSTKHRKVAVGIVYYALLSYGMDWNF